MKTNEKHLEAVKRYNRSPRGKEKRKAWLIQNADKVKTYQASYREKNKTRYSENKICTRCKKRKTRGAYTICKPCRDYNRELLKRIGANR